MRSAADDLRRKVAIAATLNAGSDLNECLTRGATPPILRTTSTRLSEGIFGVPSTGIPVAFAVSSCSNQPII